MAPRSGLNRGTHPLGIVRNGVRESRKSISQVVSVKGESRLAEIRVRRGQTSNRRILGNARQGLSWSCRVPFMLCGGGRTACEFFGSLEGRTSARAWREQLVKRSSANGGRSGACAPCVRSPRPDGSSPLFSLRLSGGEQRAALSLCGLFADRQSAGPLLRLVRI